MTRITSLPHAVQHTNNLSRHTRPSGTIIGAHAPSPLRRLLSRIDLAGVFCSNGGVPDIPTSYVFCGSDEGAAAAAATKCYADLTAGADDWGNETLDGAVATIDEAVSVIRSAIGALRSPNMFGGRKVVWMKGANFLGDSPQGARSEAVQNALEELNDCLGNLPPEMFFILSAGETDKRRAFYKKLCQRAEVKEFSKIDITKPGWESELQMLVLRQAKPLNLQFTNEALDLFIHRVNESTRQIANELAKLDVYLGPDRRRVTQEDVELMVAVSRNGVIFEISRAIEHGNVRQAVHLVNEQLEQGEQAVTIMRAAIVPTVRNRFCARLLLDTYPLDAGNYRSFESALNRLPAEGKKLLPLKKDGTPNAYSVFNAARTVAKLKTAKARRDLQACAEADRQLVSANADARDILHKLIVMLTAV